MYQTTDVTLYALTESSGDVAWAGGAGFSNPAVTLDGVYLAPVCFTLDTRPATGESIWVTNGGCASGGGGSTPVVSGGVVYAPFTESTGAMRGTRFDAQTGMVLGNYSADVLPAVDGQTGYFLQGGTLSAIALSTNTVNWTFTGDGQLTTSPILVNQYVFVGSSSGNVYGLDTTTGQVVWQTNVGATIPPGSNGGSRTPASGLSAGDGLLVIPAGTKLIAYTLSTNP